MLDSLITSKTRLRLLVKFFINSDTTAYLRNLASEFGESTSSVKQELNRLENAQLLVSCMVQNKIVYRANTKHRYYNDIHNLLLKYVGIDQLVDMLIKHIKHLEHAYVTDGLAEGNPNNIVDLILVGRTIDDVELNKLVRETEASISVKIRYLIVQPDEMSRYIHEKSKYLLIWSASGF